MEAVLEDMEHHAHEHDDAQQTMKDDERHRRRLRLEVRRQPRFGPDEQSRNHQQRQLDGEYEDDALAHVGKERYFIGLVAGELACARVSLVDASEGESHVLNERFDVVGRREYLPEVPSPRRRDDHQHDPEDGERDETDAGEAVDREYARVPAHQGYEPPEFVVEHHRVTGEEQEKDVEGEQRVKDRRDLRELAVVETRHRSSSVFDGSPPEA